MNYEIGFGVSIQSLEPLDIDSPKEFSIINTEDQPNG